VGPALIFRARALVAAGRQREADALIAELLGAHDLSDPWLHQLPFLLAELGRSNAYLAALGDDAPATPWVDAARAVAGGEYERAAEVFGLIGARAPEAQARLLRAEELIAGGRRREADLELDRALAYFRSVKAAVFTRRADALLTATA
jgi:hypothetical protein